MIKVYITDDHPSIIYGLRDMLQASNEIIISGTFTTGKDLIAGLEKALPDVLLLDIHLPDITGNQLARMITRQYPQVSILAFTNMNTDFHIKDMMHHGCRGYMLKTADTPTLIHGIKEVYAGRTFMEQSIKADIHNDLMQTRKQQIMLPSLTKREKEILTLICSGNTNQQIANKLFLSLRTIENHRFNLQQKLKVKSTVELMKVVLNMGLID